VMQPEDARDRETAGRRARADQYVPPANSCWCLALLRRCRPIAHVDVYTGLGLRRCSSSVLDRCAVCQKSVKGLETVNFDPAAHFFLPPLPWRRSQVAKAEVCKTSIAGSIPAVASDARTPSEDLCLCLGGGSERFT
jgi:hypothetical protein